MDRSSSRPLKVGLGLVPFDGMPGHEHRWANLVALARRAEAVGFDSLWVPDHLLFRDPGEAPIGAREACPPPWRPPSSPSPSARWSPPPSPDGVLDRWG
jgi:alkanesulfonate monooxygenase SsuD/methylene tetrahydromethanopterin reductase-like flavin-dependent oxidoreductase (luciferase family)